MNLSPSIRIADQDLPFEHKAIAVVVVTGLACLEFGQASHLCRPVAMLEVRRTVAIGATIDVRLRGISRGIS